MIRIESLKFRYAAGLPYVLNGVNLQVKKGEKILIAGRNGAGKTTLSKILSGLIPHVERKPYEGTYEYDGVPVRDIKYSEFVKKTAILLQDFEAQIVCTSVKEELIFYPMNLKTGYRESLARAVRLASVFGMEALLPKDIHEMSGGEKQKTAFLSLLTAEPEFLILDEPLTDIDPATQDFVLEYLKNYKGTLVVFEQSVGYAPYFDRLLIMDAGAIVSDAGAESASDEVLMEASGLLTPDIYRAAGCFVRDAQECSGVIREKMSFDEKSYSSLAAGRVSAGGNIIEVKNLFYSYKDAPAGCLHNISLDIKKGDFITVAGENGSGKTTLMKIIAGIYDDYTRGIITYKGRDIKTHPVLGSIGYVYQNPDSQIFADTVYDEIAFALRLKGADEKTVSEKTNAVMETFGLSGKKDMDPFSLPKGDREKTACASILVSSPEVVILDEPTTGLDYLSLKGLMGTIKALNNNGTTVIMITHSMETAALYGRTLLALDRGSVAFYGDKRDFFRDEALVRSVKAARTGIMEITAALNSRLLLNMDEFDLCWRKK